MNCAGHTQIKDYEEGDLVKLSILVSGQGRNAADSGEASNKISARLQINRF